MRMLKSNLYDTLQRIAFSRKIFIVVFVFIISSSLLWHCAFSFRFPFLSEVLILVSFIVIMAGIFIPIVLFFAAESTLYKAIHLFVILLLLVVFWKLPIVRATLPGKCIRFAIDGESGVYQRINDDADLIKIMRWDSELEGLCDQLLKEYLFFIDSLPRANFGDGYELPGRYLPSKYRLLGGFWGEPALILRNGDAKSEISIVFLWGNGRHNLVIFQNPPVQPPKGEMTRKISERIYIYAVYS